MQEVFTEKYFINPAIEYGIRSYKQAIEGMSFDRIYTFEMNVIYALSIIYGEKTILLPYKIDNEMAFKCNLLMYGLKESTMESFIKYMNEYYVFMKNYKSERKATGLINEIEHILIDMITKRNLKKKFRPEELNEFDKIFNPTNGELKQLKQLVGSDQGLIVREWAIQKEEITNTQLKLRAINPNLLDPRVYFKYGYDIKTIAELSDSEINDVNTIIIKEENKEEIVRTNPKIKNRLVLTTGNVLIDILIILSIVATELMLGIIAFSAFWG
jgi:hypothetical protein